MLFRSNEERILEHDEIARNPELAKYFDKNIYDLVLEQIRGPLTEARMSNHLSQFFGSKMSWNDLVEILRKHGEESIGKAELSTKAKESRTRGYNRMADIWDYHTGRLPRSKDSIDRYYSFLLDKSKSGVMIAGGGKAALSSVGETGRAILASDSNKGAIRQLIPNLITALRLGWDRKNRLKLLEMASATH